MQCISSCELGTFMYWSSDFKKVISRNRMLGIIGYGNVGKLLSKILENLNIKHKIYDPYLDLGNINDIKDCEVVSIHASYSKIGKFPSMN